MSKYGRVVTVVGAQWGDEGKGKVVDLLSKDVTACVRYNGSNNAGHTVVDEAGRRHAVHLLPAGAFTKGMTCILGRGMVFDPDVLLQEINEVLCVNPNLKLIIDGNCHLIMPYHRLWDERQEKARGASAIGTTKRGNGPAYADKASRIGIRFIDLVSGKVNGSHPSIQAAFSALDLGALDMSNLMTLVEGWRRSLYSFVGDAALELNNLIDRGESVLFAGAHGFMLDLDHGDYPFVTSSTCIASGVGAGAGVDPRLVDTVVGVVKPYGTRIGAGPFWMEMPEDLAGQIRTIGNEYGTTTGRPRRIGWLDIETLKRAVMTNRFDWMALMKLDVLSFLPEIKICLNSRKQMNGSYDPEYLVLPGWPWHDITGVTKWGDLPVEAQEFVEAIEDLVECPIRLVSTGPRRDQIIDRWEMTK